MSTQWPRAFHKLGSCLILLRSVSWTMKNELIQAAYRIQHYNTQMKSHLSKLRKRDFKVQFPGCMNGFCSGYLAKIGTFGDCLSLLQAVQAISEMEAESPTGKKILQRRGYVHWDRHLGQVSSSLTLGVKRCFEICSTITAIHKILFSTLLCSPPSYCI